MPQTGITDETEIHAMCRHYGHNWRKNDLLTSKASAGYRIETCTRSGCDAARRFWRGG